VGEGDLTPTAPADNDLTMRTTLRILTSIVALATASLAHLAVAGAQYAPPPPPPGPPPGYYPYAEPPPPPGVDRDGFFLGLEAEERRHWSEGVKAALNALAGDLVANRGWGGDCHGLKALDLVQHPPPIGELRRRANSGATRAGGELETWVGGDRGHVLVGGDLAEADDGDPERPHQAANPAT
jgi:hypothetical protein